MSKPRTKVYDFPLGPTNVIDPSARIIGAAGTILEGIKPEDFEEERGPEFYTKVDNEDFYIQLEEFKRDNTLMNAVKVAPLVNERYIIEVFQYETNKGSILEGIQKKEFTHVAKILSVGTKVDKPFYSVGDIVLLNPAAVCGETDNPDWLHVLQYSQGNIKPILPIDMKEKVGMIQVRFDRYFYLLPHQYSTPRDQVVTYAVPESEITAKYIG